MLETHSSVRRTPHIIVIARLPHAASRPRHSHPSCVRAMTTPDPARAENRKPALKTVKMAKPWARSRTERGMTWMRVEIASARPSRGRPRTCAHLVKPVVLRVDEAPHWSVIRARTLALADGAARGKERETIPLTDLGRLAGFILQANWDGCQTRPSRRHRECSPGRGLLSPMMVRVESLYRM